jgi:hypothetical protein
VSPRGSRWDAHRAADIATRRAVMARDAGLRRISIVTRWAIAGVVGLSGGLALLASSAFHGHTIVTTPTSSASQAPGQTTPAVTTPAQTTPAVSTPAVTTPAQTTPAQTAPAQTTPSSVQAPTPTPAAPVVVSGGS